MAKATTEQPDPEPGWVRATLELAVLAVLTEGDRHGYALAQRLGERGLGPVRGGVLYPVLNRLETEAAVSSSWQAGDGGPGRKVYAITDDGRRRLHGQRASWHRFTSTFDKLLRQTAGER
ncbi:PadR family transcriptional regulator [Actinoplanes teichomyceticus]|uniref:PadR family transcriptional regulator n=1 Tax=Actinoplanes teichomyceticus TaxID=1867 RepID=A0A561VMV0_ACTTI|nr:PadR family transcriptional regulator [Actinoplanes teichomyceticus]TWG12935.1 PadR family transcriptional regulator [Actinoplanes teichomyceticus]GIF13689.1 PadR family transcriptional regulator [Actinoplanes teichomyceticus]